MVELSGIEPLTSWSACKREALPAELKPHNIMKLMVGKTGFEPATPWSQTKCSTKLSYFPK